MSVNERWIEAVPGDVFRALVDPVTYPGWLVGAKRIRRVSAGWPSVGSEFHHVVGFGPLELADRTTVVGLDEPRRLELLVRARPLIEATVQFELAATAGGCTVRMTETPRGLYRLSAALAGPVIHARNERSLARLAEVVQRRSLAPDRRGTAT